MAEFKEIQIGADGQVYQVKDETARNNAGGYTPPEGGIPKADLAPAVQTSLGLADTALQAADKAQLQSAIDAVQTALDNLMNGESVTDAIDTFNEVKAFLNGINTEDDTLATQLLALDTAIKSVQQSLLDKANTADVARDYATKDELSQKANDNAVVKSISVNGTAQTKDSSGNVNIQVQAGDQVSVIQPDPADGTFIIRVGSTDYTINLNHTHEGMAKLVKCTEATLPQTMADDTIYVQVDNLTTPTDIEALHIFGLEFTGGGGATPGVPYLSSPGANISMGDTENGSVTKSIYVKGRFLTQALSATLTGTGYTFGVTQPTGVTRNSDTSLTIDPNTAKDGVNISVIYTGSSFNATGTLSIISSSPDSIDTESTLVANALDNDGLIGHWDASDAPSSGAWVDRINSMKLNLGGTAAQTSDGYRLNNLSASKDAYMILDESAKTVLNTNTDTKIGKEFTCIVDCLVKFSASNARALVIDFGAVGNSASGVSLSGRVTQTGAVEMNAKTNGNNLASIQENDVVFKDGGIALDTYFPIRMRCGVKVASNGTQVMFVKVGNATAFAYGPNDVSYNVNFQGCSDASNSNPYPFALGVGYLSASSAAEYAPYFADVIYKNILLFNKVK